MFTRQSTSGVTSLSPTSPVATAIEVLRDTIERRLDMPPWVLLVQAFIGLGWLRAAVEKLIDPSSWSGAVLTGFLAEHADRVLPWYDSLLDTVIAPNLLAVSIIVVVAQLFAGFALLSGWRVPAALAAGAFLNLNFIAAGAVNPSIFYLICQAALLLWILQSDHTVRTRHLRLLATASFAMVLLNVPFISTLDPAMVVEDPAMVLITLGLLTAVASRAGVHYSQEALEVRVDASPYDMVHSEFSGVGND